MPIDFRWRAPVRDEELRALHAEGFGTDGRADCWAERLQRHSLGWVTAHDHDRLVGFVNVAWDGGRHAFLLDTVVAVDHRHTGVGTGLVRAAVIGARSSGCQWVHVDFEADLARFYLSSCGFAPTSAGLVAL
ncbi:GNAT family N-acetyltransferase [Actinoalloteichus caeruleus]|uniref:GNAT family N-acetyltransferase n=1 Tax=Actinoalloteichus cyanogriseus TaxID=2893586 RepID=UPI0004AAC08E|nr:GNAT family N-acetyltransferase [Actinoalloteichus caeruleus]